MENIPVPPDYSGTNLAGYWHNRILAEVYSLNRKCPILSKTFKACTKVKILHIDEVINLDINYVLSFVSIFLEKNGFLEKDIQKGQVFTSPSVGSFNNQSFGSKGFRPDPGEIGDLAGSAIGGVGGGPVGIFVGGFLGTWLGNSLSYAWQNSTL
jgi:hypothetical protein